MLILVIAGWGGSCVRMFFCFFILFRNSQVPTLPCHQQMIKKKLMRGRRRLLHSELVRGESTDMRGPDLPQWALPQPAALEKRFRCLGLGLNRAETATLCEAVAGAGGTSIFLEQPVGTREECLLFCCNQPLPNLAGVVLLWLYYCCHLSCLLRTYPEA